MRRLVLSVVLVLVAACGSASPTGVAPPPPPAAPGPPASVTIAAGNGQQGQPGSVLPIKPAVLVKDASGLPVPGVVVAFAIDSGGGSLTSSSATTGTNGVATAGSWTLGGVAMTNVVIASAAGLPSVRFIATAQSVVLDQIQSTAGGTLTVSSPGSAVDGLQIVVPPSSFATPIHWQVSSRATDDLPARPGLNPISPLITIHTGVGTYADSGILVRIPAHITPGYFAMAFYYDRSVGTIEALPLASSDANSVTIMTRHFSAAALVPTGGGSAGLRASLRGSGIPAVGEVEIVISQIDPAGLDQDISSPFRAATDGWEINNPSGWAISAGGHCAGWTITAVWYYYTQRNAVGSLFNRFSTDPAIWEDNVRGWRWADLTWGDVNWETYASVLFPELKAQYNPTPAYPATLALNEQRALAYAIKVTGMPQFLGLLGVTGLGHAVAAYRVASNTVYYADPNLPGVERSAALTADFLASGATWHYQMMIGVSSFIPFDKIAARWQTFQDQTIGDAEYPAMPVEQALVTGTDTAWITVTDTIRTPDATVRLRTRCPACPSFAGGLGDGSQIRPLSVTGATATTAVLIPFTRDPVTFDPIFNSTPPYHEEYAIATNVSVSQFGALLIGLRPAANGGGRAMVDYRPITVIYTQGAIIPASPVQAVGTPLSLRFQMTPFLPPAKIAYHWDFGDGKPQATIDDDPNVEHTWDAVGSYLVTGEVLDVQNNNLVIARASTIATITAGKWQLATFQQTGLVTDPNYAFFEDSKTMNELRDSTIARPAGATLQIFVGGATLPVGIKEPSDFLVRADVNVSAPSMFLSFPRGLPSGGLLAEAVAATGAGSSAALAAACGSNCFPMSWVNAFAQGGAAGAATYVGTAGNWVLQVPIQANCQGVPVQTPAKSPVEGYLEINATQNSSGLQGTITFVTPVNGWRLQSGPNICPWDHVTEIRRTFTFTAVPAP